MPKISLLERGLQPYLMTAASGAAGVLCFAPFEQFWLAPLIWLSFFHRLREASSPAQAMRLGLTFGLGFFLVGVSWVYVSLSVFGGMPWWLSGPATFLFCTVMAGFPMLAAGAFKRWQPADFWRQALFFAALVATADWLRSWVFTGFPWLILGYSQTLPSPLAGFAPLLGVHGLSLLVALSAALLLRWRIGLTFLAVLSLTGVGLGQIAWTTPVGQAISVALIQGNVPQEMKFRPDAFSQTLSLYRSLIEDNPAQLTILPETAFPVFFDQLPPDYLDSLKVAAQRQGGDLIMGTLTGDGEHYYNSAISLGQSPLQVYSKHHLVPFGEIIPPGFAWFIQFANIPLSSFSPGPESQAALSVAGQQVAVNICYEDVFGEAIIRALPTAGILANLSNTAWFGRSLAQPQHLQIARMRAAETGRPMLRATNTGMTAIISPNGTIDAVLNPFITAVLKGKVQAHEGWTPYARVGNWLALSLILGCGLLGWSGKRRLAT